MRSRWLWALRLVCAMGEMAEVGEPGDRAARVRPDRVGNAFGGADLHSYGVFFVVAFVWIGMAHPPRTSAAMAPLAAAAYVLPLFVLPGGVEAGLSSAAITIPVCVLVGEGIAWGVGRLEQIELALQRERDRTEQLRELDEMKDRFLSAVSHELRTPITICRGHLEVLEDGADDQEVRAVRAMCVDELDLMGRLVGDLTTLARADGRALLKVESLPLDSFLSGITAKAETILGERVRVESGIGDAMLRADPQRLTQALVNLVQNAARPRQRGWARVPSRASRTSSWRFEVADDGGGLPPATNRWSSSRSAPDHRTRRHRVGAVHRPGDRHEPTAESRASLTGRGGAPRSGSGFRGEAPGRRGRRAGRVVPRTKGSGRMATPSSGCRPARTRSGASCTPASRS